MMEQQAIERHLDQAIEALRNTSRDPNQDALLFLGAWNDAYPSILVHDPFLTDSAKIQWLYLTQEARKQPHGAIAMPSVNKTSSALRHSRGTVIRDRALLRITRWISLMRRVRDAGSGRFAGNVYAIHGEPAVLADAMRYDNEYMQLIERAASDHNDPKAKYAAQAALTTIEHNAAMGRDPLAPVDMIARRVDAAMAIKGESASYFELHYDGNKRSGGLQIVNSSDESPGPNFEPGETPGPKFELGMQVIDSFSGSNFEPGECSCSSSYITTTTNSQHSNFELPEPIATLQWPQGLDDNMRRLVYRSLAKAIEPVHHQDILHALAHKALDQDDPLRSPVSYVLGCCQRIRSGEFHPVGPPPQHSEPKSSEPSRSTVTSNLRGEICALEQLIKGTKAERQRVVLERQLEQLRHRLEKASMREELTGE